MSALTVIIITYNEEPDIAACLESVAWADEIVVVDCGSTDDTVAICRRYSSQVHVTDRRGSGPQKQRALDLATTPWVLNIDADEQIPGPLREEILQVIGSPGAADGFHILRRNIFLGKEIRYCGWQDDRPLRLFRRSCTEVTDTQVHEGFIVTGTVARLTNSMYHDAYKSLFQYFEKLNEYTSIEVRNRLRARPGRRISWIHIALAPLGTFWKLYVVKAGFRDGMRGFLLCMLSSVSQMVGYAKIWEYQMRHLQGNRWFPPIRTEELTSRQPGYNRLHSGGDDEFNFDGRKDLNDGP